MVLYKNGAYRNRSGDWSVFIYPTVCTDEHGNEGEVEVELTEKELEEYLNDIKEAKAGGIAVRNNY